MNLKVLQERWDLLPESVREKAGRRGFSDFIYLCDLVQERKCINILEIGTFLGRTACHIAAVCAPFGGKVTTINVSKSEYDSAKELADELGLDNIDFRLGDSLQVIPQLEGDWDLVFIDGHHSYKYSMGEYNLVKDKMKSDSVIIFDDAGGVHNDSNGDGGVPRTVRESGAHIVQWGTTKIGLVYSKTKIVFAAKFNKNSTNVSQSNAMKRRGVELIEFEIEAKGYADHLIETCKKERPQLLLLSKCQGMDNKVIREVQSMGIKCFLWFMDPLFTFNKSPEMIERIKLCDHSFFTIWETLEEALKISKNCSFLREGFDADTDYPRPLDYERDVAFIGNMREGRYEYSNKVKFDLITDAYRGRHAEVVSSTRINLNFTDGGAQDRVYKVMAAGGFLLTEPWPRMDSDFKIGVDLDVFNSPDELNEKIAYYLKNEDIREMIAKNGYKKAMQYSRDEWSLKIIGKFLENE